jgi:hypothetical protein
VSVVGSYIGILARYWISTGGMSFFLSCVPWPSFLLTILVSLSCFPARPSWRLILSLVTTLDLRHLLDLNSVTMPRLFGNSFLPINELAAESAERVLRNYGSVEQLARLSQDVARESRAPGILEFLNQRTARMLELDYYVRPSLTSSS